MRETQGRAVAAASVSLSTTGGVEILSVVTDTAGHYRFANLHEGSYKVKAERAGYGNATIEHVNIAKGEAKTVDLVLSGVKNSSDGSSAKAPEFFDEPTFSVAGVTDPSNLGGHGSDTVVRTKESLARTAASLGKEGAANAPADSLETEAALRESVARNPADFDANYRLGKVLLDRGHSPEALPYLRRASEQEPGNYESSFELAKAYFALGDLENARTQLARVRTRQDKAELHHLLGDVEEKAGDSLRAVQEFERAATMDPSEPYLFDWGAELLIHRAPEPAGEVFSKGIQRFPRSLRMIIGLGAAEFARGSYTQASERFCAAADLNPDDPVSYRLMNQVQNADREQARAVSDRLERFARLHPENAEANYFYAQNLWKLRKGPDDASIHQAETLLLKAVQINPKFSDAYLQLGIVYTEQKRFRDALEAYQTVIAADPRSEEAHYRLSQLHRQMGDSAKAKVELRLYEQIAKENTTETERERKAMKQFVYTLREQQPARRPQ